MEKESGNRKYILKQPLKYRLNRKDFFSSQICRAASRNMFIDSSGNVSPCCFNRETVFGNILENDNEKIVNSPVRHDLESKLKVNDLSKGCLYCHKTISDNNYKASGSLTYDLPVFQKGHFPCFMEFELDTFCNLNCVMCPPELHSSKAQNLFGPEFVEKITPLIKKLKWTKFYGGEPFVIAIYYDIWERLIEVNPECKITVQTNATVYNDKIKQLLTKGNFRFSVSLDSLDPINYEAIRRGASFNKVMENLSHFIEYSRISHRPLNLAVCPMNINLKDIPDIVQYANSNSLYIYFNLLQYPRNLSPKYMSSKYIGDTVSLFQECRIPYRNRVSAEIKRHFKSLINQMIQWRDEALEREKIPITEIEKPAIIDLLCKGLTSEKKALAEHRFLMAFSAFDNKLHLRRDTLLRISSLKPDEILHFLENHSEEKLAESISDIIRFGF